MSEENKPKTKFDTDKLVMQNIMSRDEGREYMWKKLQSYGVFENIFNNDSIQHAYQSGRRAAGLELDADIREHTPAEYLMMIKENM